ncbi:glycosyl hydrolase catalytic core-domain-containing protein [Lentinula raphanica]|uniref:Glycosyl hydrolase catalytic core-domain-containing protein n=1 Tax=Lentinula raphanica TaxID=153919 RepID=A0AA38PA36_9AGAR|nr:glycosyl hydrolase catalytic core-domain-containing protein [Lentinula raphanica]KAJ3839122.1 glycosyl hydrolase catalytic core-domain-containing protein [Lentinula raphanica]KAJ3969918.1 glycosyl hydrolase catalytic core-domain-containing protein [Lentinula raphanica]
MSLSIVLIFLVLHVIPVSTFVNKPLPNNRATNSKSSKAGLAWPNGNADDIDQYLTTGKVSWYYTWSPDAISSTNIEFVPMLWGNKTADDFSSSINDTISSKNVTSVLGMNEPQQTGQSDLTPAEGAALWKTYLEPLKAQGIRLGSPAPSSAPSGKTWLQDFLTNCNGSCTVDFIALHWYDINATAFIEYLEDFHNTFQRPLWVTEWACQNYNGGSQCSYDDIVLFLNATQSYMDSSDFVERYSYFGAMQDLQGVNKDNALMNSNGQINTLGKQYIGEQAPQTSGSGSADGPYAPGGTSGASILKRSLALESLVFGFMAIFVDVVTVI